MGIGVVDSSLFSDAFGSKKMANMFSERVQVQRWLDVEAALARAEALVGLIPTEAADEISRQAIVENFDLDVLAEQIAATTHPIVPVIRELSAACANEWGEYVHWGATTQDIMDTALVLQLRDAAEIILEDLVLLRDSLTTLAEHHRETIMPGRTHAQHAVPITFGYKVAVWLDEVHRHIGRLQKASKGLSVTQFGGAAGTLASVGPIGIEIRRLLGEELGLDEPTISWHVSRDRLVEFALALTFVGGTLQRIAREIITLQRTEIAEVEEPFHHGKIGSSTMPHKRNPMFAETTWALGTMVQHACQVAIASLQQEHERDMAAWQLEWDIYPRICSHTHKMIELSRMIVSGLNVHEDRMMENLELTKGLIYSEALMMRLGKTLGRQSSHHILYDLAMDSFNQSQDYRDLARQHPDVSRVLGSEQLDEVFDPKLQILGAVELVDRVLDDVRSNG